jgi:hypothetical protein
MTNKNSVVSGGKVKHKLIRGVNKQNHDKNNSRAQGGGNRGLEIIAQRTAATNISRVIE